MKLKHFLTKSEFERHLSDNSINDTDLCFIKETSEIYTHGKLYASTQASDSEDIFIPLSRDFNDDFNNDFAR